MARAPRSTPNVRLLVQEQARAAVQGVILEAAGRLLERVGFREFKMSELAAEAGVAVGTLYNYFASREAVIDQLVSEGQAQFAARLAEPYGDAEPLERLLERVRRMLAFIDERGALFAEFARVSIEGEADLRQLAGKNAKEGYLALRSLLAADLAAAQGQGRIRADIDPIELAVCLGGLVNTTILHWIEAGCVGPLAARAQPLFELFLHGATPR